MYITSGARLATNFPVVVQTMIALARQRRDASTAATAVVWVTSITVGVRCRSSSNIPYNTRSRVQEVQEARS